MAPPNAFSTKRPGFIEIMHRSSIVITNQSRNGQIDIVKNRYGPHGKNVPLNEAIDIVADLLCQKKYEGRLKMFQEGLREKLIEQMKTTLNTEGGEENEGTIWATSHRNGSDPNRLQRVLSIFGSICRSYL